MGRALPGHEVEIVDEAGNVLPPGDARHHRSEAARSRHAAGILAAARTRRPPNSPATGCSTATSRRRTRTAISGSRAATTTSSSRRATASARPRSRIAWSQHPAVRLAGVIGTPDPVRGEAVTAFIVLAEGHQPSEALAADIQAFVRSRLAAHEYPRKIRFIADMPMTVTGKIRRLDLRALEEDGGQPTA